jgi:hypothetical protein
MGHPSIHVNFMSLFPQYQCSLTNKFSFCYRLFILASCSATSGHDTARCTCPFLNGKFPPKKARTSRCYGGFHLPAVLVQEAWVSQAQTISQSEMCMLTPFDESTSGASEETKNHRFSWESVSEYFLC